MIVIPRKTFSRLLANFVTARVGQVTGALREIGRGQTLPIPLSHSEMGGGSWDFSKWIGETLLVASSAMLGHRNATLCHQMRLIWDFSSSLKGDLSYVKRS